MVITKEIETEVTRFMDNYWNTYLQGDIGTWSTYLAEDYKNIGGKQEEIWNSRKEIIDYTMKVPDQIRATTGLRNKKTEVFSLTPYVLAHEFVDVYSKIENEWAFYGKFRLSTILERSGDSWKVIHQHGSYPHSKTDQGEAFAFDKMSIENRELKEAIKRQTTELENKNRELQIETSLEKVRTVAMGMRTPDDILGICKCIFTELQLLGFSELRNSLINFWDDDNGVLIDYDYSDETGAHKAQLLYSSHPVFDEFQQKIRQSKDSFAELVVNEGLLESWKLRRRESGEYEDPRLDGIRALYYYFYSIGVGAVGISTFSSLDTEKLNILKRFKNVIEFAYRRYMDVAQAEAQAKEAKIELGLERVRARAMAMQNSNELAELVSVLFTELTQLGFTLTSCIIWIHDPGIPSNTLWIASGEMNKPAEPFYIQPFHHDFFTSIVHAWKAKDPKWVFQLTGAEKGHFENAFFNELPNLPEALKNALTIPKQVVFSASFNNFGALEIVETEALTDEKFNILHRFGKVFDASFTRFNDLQKAEAQAREAQIELGLERVRARAMAMQKSGELKELIGTVFTELTKLDLVLTRCLIMIFDPDTKGSTWWMANSEDASRPMGLSVKYHALPPYLAYIEAWGQRMFKWQYILEGTDKKSWDDFLFTETELSGLPGFVIAGMKSPDRVYLSASFNNFGCLNLASLSALSAEHNDILLRFAKVFDLTYTRFNDLQKAEGQVREAQIETALERVRSRSMGMQKSEELKEVIQVVYEQFVHLNIHIEHTGFIMDYKANDDMNIWLADKHEVPSQVTIPYFDCAHWNSFNEAKEKGKDFFANYLDFEEKNRFYRDLFTLFPVPDEARNYYLGCPGLAISTVLLENVGLYIENFSGIPYTEEENNTLMRFGKVFQQTYTRFLDLQRVEEQARESQIEAALEKVRSRSLAMHKSDELQEVVHTVFEKLKELDVDLYTAIIFIFTEGTKDIVWWLENKVSQQYARILVPYVNNPYLADIFEAKEKGKELFSVTYSFKEKNDLFHHLFENTDFKNTPEKQKEYLLQTELATMSVALAKNTAINITSYTRERFSEKENEILKRFSKVFDQSYTRFLDLQKAEAQAREAQIEASLERVRSKAMAMHSSQDLSDTIVAFYHELELFSITPRRCGVGLLNKETRIAELSTMNTTEEGKSIEIVGKIKMEKHPVLENVYKNWLLNKEYHPVLRGNEIKEYYQLLRPQIAFPDYPYDTVQFGYFFFFPEGGVYAWTDKEMAEEELIIYRRFTSVLSLTYKRYKDLQQAEALAVKAEQDLVLLKEEKKRTEDALAELQVTQKQLIQSEKMASLGELTAGIAHEIQNPLNFVNNFSEVSNELLDEMMQEVAKGNYDEAKAIADDVKQNLEKINHHGKRADGIVKGMLQHSRSSTGQKEPTNINALADEYTRLAYHGLRAKNKSFNATLKTDFDETIGNINIIPQDIGRVILNLITNAFYAVNEKALSAVLIPAAVKYEPTVSIRTKRIGNKIEIKITDNGNGIPQKIQDKIFQPFFTTKPTGQGTGLGLSLAFDIVKSHGGELNVETQDGEGTTMIILLPA